MLPPPTFLAVFSPWKEAPRPGHVRPPHLVLQDDLARRIAASSSCPARLSRHHDLILVDLLDVPGLLAAVDTACRGRAWACGICLRPTPNPKITSLRVAELARRSPWGLAVRRDRTDPAVAPVAAALGLHVTVLRERTSTQWRALDALRRHGTCTAAADALDVSPQAVSKLVRASNARATSLTSVLLQEVLRPDESIADAQLGVAPS